MALLQPMLSISLAHRGLQMAPPIPEKDMAMPVAVPELSGNHWVSSMGMATLPTHPAAPHSTADMYHRALSAPTVSSRKPQTVTS